MDCAFLKNTKCTSSCKLQVFVHSNIYLEGYSSWEFFSLSLRTIMLFDIMVLCSCDPAFVLNCRAGNMWAHCRLLIKFPLPQNEIEPFPKWWKTMISPFHMEFYDYLQNENPTPFLARDGQTFFGGLSLTFFLLMTPVIRDLSQWFLYVFRMIVKRRDTGKGCPVLNPGPAT